MFWGSSTSIDGRGLDRASIPGVAGARNLSSRAAGQGQQSISIVRALPELISFGLILAQFVLIALILRETDIQTPAFRRLIYLSIGGFIVNHFLPMAWRLRFFTILSLMALLVVMGGTPAPGWSASWAIERSGTLLVVAGLLIGICLMPIGYWMRAGLLVVVGIVVALFRAGALHSGNLAIVWPVLAAMFMFRLVIYLYDVSTSKQRPALSQSLSYFLLIPNACILFFPVIDSKTFWRKYYDEDAIGIYQRGIRWMGRGIIQLLLYRFVDQLVSLRATDVFNGSDLIQYVVANSFLYLKVSGEFHLFVGLLLLFGFNLPETNHRYFLASSFTDYWRRVNIYWKDFMMKVFYYPAFFKLKKFGQTQALVLATLWSFAVTWAFHLYQTWWIKGSVSFTWPDGLFWGILGLLVVANALHEMKRGRQRKLGGGGYTLKSAAGLCLRTAGTFAIVSILWSLWSTPTLGQWLHIWSLADRHSLGWGILVLLGVMIATVIFEILPLGLVGNSLLPVAPGYAMSARFKRDVLQCALPLLAIFVIAMPRVQARLTAAPLQPYRDALAVGDRLGAAGGAGRGYYESLTAVDDGAQQFWESARLSPVPYAYVGADPVRPVADFRFRELIPNVHEQAYGVDFQTNKWGMRDRDYDLAAPAGTLRMALLGSSHVMGYGLESKDMFKYAVEGKLNTEHSADGHFEILNFAVNGLSPLGQITVLQNRVPQFHPQIILFVAHMLDFDWVNRDVPRALREHVPIPYDFLNQILAKARVTGRTNDSLASDRLYPYDAQMLEFCYARMVDQCKAIHAAPVLVYLPAPMELTLPRSEMDEQLALARQAGFIVIDLSHIFDGLDPNGLMLPEGMHHCNARADAIIADALYKQLVSDPRIQLLALSRQLIAGRPN
jgi:alginate O-acetyltransferase complex protein AlgI